MKRELFRRGLALLLAACALLSCAACGGKAAAAAMRLRKTEGTVGVLDDGGKDLEPRENLGLYSGYGVDTRAESYAWIDLDDVKLTKLDQDSEIKIKKEDRHLEIEVLSGSLFFNVTEPLADDETMEIRTSSMLVGIRGTCGWVTQDTAALLEGTVTITAGEQAVTVNAGEMAVLSREGELQVRPFTDQEIPAFVREETRELPPEEAPEGPQDTPDPGAEVQDAGELQDLLRPEVEKLNLPLTVDQITYGVTGIEAAKSAYLDLPYAMSNPMYDSEREEDDAFFEGRAFDTDAVYACFGMNGMPIPEGYQEGEFAFLLSAPYSGGGISYITISQPGFLCLDALQVGDDQKAALELFAFPDSPPQVKLEWPLNNGGSLTYEPFDSGFFTFSYHYNGTLVRVTVTGGRVHNICFLEEE